MYAKKWLSLGLSLILTAGIAGCGGSDNNNGNGGTTNGKPDGGTAAPATETGQPVQLKYWTDDRHDQEYIKELINKFNETNGDNIQVELTVMSEITRKASTLHFPATRRRMCCV